MQIKLKLFFLATTSLAAAAMQPQFYVELISLDNKTPHNVEVITTEAVANGSGTELGKMSPLLPMGKKSSLQIPLKFPLPKDHVYHLNILAKSQKKLNIPRFSIELSQKGNTLHAVLSGEKRTSGGKEFLRKEKDFTLEPNKKMLMDITVAGNDFEDTNISVVAQEAKVVKPAATLAPIKLAPKTMPKPAAK